MPAYFVYFHVSRELTQEAIFADDQDYQTFTDYLKNYFANPNNLENTKKIFTIRGRTYQGSPRQTQNFHKQVELIAYKLEPHRFDLVIKDNGSEAHKKLIRALSTRYALYFNKKYDHKGALFNTPYNSQPVNDGSLSQLISDLHGDSSNHSSNPEYTGQRNTSWIKAQPIHITKEVQKPSQSKTYIRVPEIIFAGLILALLSILSLRNIQAAKTPVSLASATPVPEILGEEQTQTTKLFVTIKINDGANEVNLREGPTTSSPIIGKAKQDDRFEFVDSNSDWYQIIVDNGTTGFVSTRYAELENELINE